jgi:hypothetical protein
VQENVFVPGAIVQHLTVASALPDSSTCWCCSKQDTRFVWLDSVASCPDFEKPLMLPSPKPQKSHSPAATKHQHTSPNGTSTSGISSKRPDAFFCGLTS